MIKEFDNEDEVLVTHHISSDITEYMMQRYCSNLKHLNYSLHVDVPVVPTVEYMCKKTEEETSIPYIHVGLSPIDTRLQQRYKLPLDVFGSSPPCDHDTYDIETLQLQSTMFSIVDNGKFKYVSQHMSWDGIRRFTIFALDKRKVFPHLDEQMLKSLTLIEDLYENGWS